MRQLTAHSPVSGIRYPRATFNKLVIVPPLWCACELYCDHSIHARCDRTLTADLTLRIISLNQLWKQTECCAVGSRHGGACRKVVDDFRHFGTLTAREQNRGVKTVTLTNTGVGNPNDFKPILPQLTVFILIERPGSCSVTPSPPKLAPVVHCHNVLR